MPTPVNSARQCLTQEAAAALDDAVKVARRRGHGQTTSLHLVSSLLALPNSSLREACAWARNNNIAYSTRVQFKALELSLSVSLDRLPSNSQNRSDNEPPVSNSLMAAIKRSQANQRRQPENYTFYQQPHQQKQQQQYSSSSSCSSIPVVKVELQNLIISILDDPLVNRVFGEAGFRNYDIKMAILRKGNSFHHPSQVFGSTSRYKRPSPPLFLCNFPFTGGCFSGDHENSRKIAEIMKRDKKKCPLLLGVSAVDALKIFLEKIVKGVVLVDGLSGLRVVCVKDEIFRCLNGDCDVGPLRLKFEEVEKMVGNCKVVVNFGDLKELGDDGVDNIDGLRFLVKKLGKLVEVYSGKLWLLGAAASYEVYFKILNKFPTIEEDWDLDVLPITSFKFSVGGSYPISRLMGSFVPLGGFFSMLPETKSPPSCQKMARCHLCNEKYEQEVAALSNGELRVSVAEQYQPSLPSWLQQPSEPSPQSGSSPVKGKDDSLLVNTKITWLGRKWDGICRQNHLGQTFLKGYQFPRFPGCQVAEDRKENESNNGSYNSNESSNEQGNKNISSSSSLKGPSSSDMLSKAKNLSILSKSGEIPSESKDEAGGVKSLPLDSLNAGIIDDHRSPTSVITSVTTDLGLGITSCPLSTNIDTFISKCPSQSSSCYYDAKDPKSIYKALVERVCRQEEAISAIVDTITKCRTKTSCRNVWINIRGADRLGKKKLGLALAEILYGSKECLIYVDLSFQNETTHSTETLFNRQGTNIYDLTMRGTVVDYLVEKLSEKPSVVFLENIDKSDLVVQNSLLQAVKTGTLTDLRGREVNISNCIFLGTMRYSGGSSQTMPSGKKSNKYAEEDILSAKGSSVQMVIGFDLNDNPTNENLLSMNKRKLVAKSTSTKRAHKASESCLDLNLPAEGSEICDTVARDSESGSSSENSRSWLEDFDGQIDRLVAFEPFDFDALAEKLLKEINLCLRNVVGSECSIEIEMNVMRQILAAAYLFGNKRVEDWIRDVVSEAFLEAMGKFGLDARSIVKIVRCEGIGSEELLPARILIK